MRRNMRRTTKKHFRGGSIMSWLRKAGSFLKDKALPYIKKHQLASKALNLIPHPYAKTASRVASTLGYGRRRSKGGELRLAGGALYM